MLRIREERNGKGHGGAILRIWTAFCAGGTMDYSRIQETRGVQNPRDRTH